MREVAGQRYKEEREKQRGNNTSKEKQNLREGKTEEVKRRRTVRQKENGTVGLDRNGKGE